MANFDLKRIVGSSTALAQTLEHVSALAQIERPVLICGERGSGKELMAERLHYLSSRWDQPYITLNCAAISEDLIESELFGHEQGAFTGATKNHQGRFERADGGTLFLDELGTLSHRVQEKLLRVIEYGEYERLGSGAARRVDVRIVAATNENLPELASTGRFRHDLLDRLAFDVVNVPPLRLRQEDIEELAQFFALRFSIELGWDNFSGFSDTALQSLHNYHWPGNVRELKNVVERSLFRTGNEISLVDKIVINPFQEGLPQNTASDQSIPVSAIQKPNTESQLGFKEQVQQLQRQLVEQALEKTGNNQRQAAKLLSLSYDQFRGVLRKLRQI